MICTRWPQITNSNQRVEPIVVSGGWTAMRRRCESFSAMVTVNDITPTTGEAGMTSATATQWFFILGLLSSWPKHDLDRMVALMDNTLDDGGWLIIEGGPKLILDEDFEDWSIKVKSISSWPGFGSHGLALDLGWKGFAIEYMVLKISGIRWVWSELIRF